MATLQDMMNAITQEENVNPSYNNPGAIFSNGSLAHYATLDEGNNALQNLLTNAVSGTSKIYSPNMTLDQFEQTYTGGDMNAGNNVASIMGVPASTQIGSIDLSGVGSQNNQNLNLGNGQSIPFSQLKNMTPGQIGNMLKQTNPNIAGAGASAPWETWIQTKTGAWVSIIIGVVLIAGAVFGFKNMSVAVTQGVRKGAELSAA